MKSYYFTMKHPDATTCSYTIWGYVEVRAESSIEAREKMVAKHGLAWGFEYNTLDQVHPLDRNLIEVIE